LKTTLASGKPNRLQSRDRSFARAALLRPVQAREAEARASIPAPRPTGDRRVDHRPRSARIAWSNLTRPCRQHLPDAHPAPEALQEVAGFREPRPVQVDDARAGSRDAHHENGIALSGGARSSS